MKPGSRCSRKYSYSDELTPYAGLIYDFDHRFSGYVSYTEIFQTQNVRSTNGSLLDPITGRNYELGLKATLADALDMTKGRSRMCSRRAAAAPEVSERCG